MPELDGFAAARAIRKLPSRVEIVFLTVHREPNWGWGRCRSTARNFHNLFFELMGGHGAWPPGCYRSRV
jgi:hypothetical protein